MEKPNRVTFTGVDERTDLSRLISLSRRYPVEWGVLFSKQNQGRSNRYPKIGFVTSMLNRLEKEINPPVLSAHICGKYSNDILEKNVIDMALLQILAFSIFKRSQINIRDGESFVKDGFSLEKIKDYQNILGLESVIIQCVGSFPRDTSVNWLYDTSGGRGVVPDSWNANEDNTDAYCGYAGGIGPSNVTAVLKRIDGQREKKKSFWIDMEGNVRTGDWLDLDKCASVLSQIYG